MNYIDTWEEDVRGGAASLRAVNALNKIQFTFKNSFIPVEYGFQTEKPITEGEARALAAELNALAEKGELPKIDTRVDEGLGEHTRKLRTHLFIPEETATDPTFQADIGSVNTLSDNLSRYRSGSAARGGGYGSFDHGPNVVD